MEFGQSQRYPLAPREGVGPQRGQCKSVLELLLNLLGKVFFYSIEVLNSQNINLDLSVVTYATLWEGLIQNDSYPKESLGKRFWMSSFEHVDLAILETNTPLNFSLLSQHIPL